MLLLIITVTTDSFIQPMHLMRLGVPLLTTVALITGWLWKWALPVCLRPSKVQKAEENLAAHRMKYIFFFIWLPRNRSPVASAKVMRKTAVMASVVTVNCFCSPSSFLSQGPPRRHMEPLRSVNGSPHMPWSLRGIFWSPENFCKLFSFFF